MKLTADADAVKNWYYPVHPDRPLRQYQSVISERCLHRNTLVAIPTGLGKTFIAGVVMLNCKSPARAVPPMISQLAWCIHER